MGQEVGPEGLDRGLKVRGFIEVCSSSLGDRLALHYANVVPTAKV